MSCEGQHELRLNYVLYLILLSFLFILICCKGVENIPKAGSKEGIATGVLSHLLQLV